MLAFYNSDTRIVMSNPFILRCILCRNYYFDLAGAFLSFFVFSYRIDRNFQEFLLKVGLSVEVRTREVNMH